MATGGTSREPSSFGSLVRRLRVAAGLTQEQLAARAGLSPDTIALLERGKRHIPRAGTVRLLADALALGDAERAAFLAAARPEPARAGAADSGTETEAALPLRYLATPATPLIDRADELASIVHRLTREDVRLLTLVGPAGVGKTRLALAAAAHVADISDRFPEGVTLVDLTPVREPSLVLGTLARALGLLDTGSRPLLERMLELLGERPRLVVLDNFEQVLPAATQLAELLAACPGLTLLVTSRVPLQLRAEQTLRIAPLPVPDLREALPPLEALLAIPAVELFVERARARRADFVLRERHAPVVAQLVVGLDGLPLALELAAARMDVLLLPTLARRLGDRLRLLTSEAPDRPTRQQSLEAAVGWSYDLLSEAEQRLFRCLGVFVGRVSLDAIFAVVSAVGAARGAGRGDGRVEEAREAGRTLPRLLSLAEKSLLLPIPARPEAEALDEEEPAFGMLETVREYARERLEAVGELDAALRAHAHYFLALAERAQPKLRGPDQRTWYFRLEREHDNLRAALRWLLDQDDPAEGAAALRLAGALGWFWAVRGYHAEGRRWLEEALARSPEADASVRLGASLRAGLLLTTQAAYARALAALEEARALAEQQHDPGAIAEALTDLGFRAVLAGEGAEATRVFHEARRRWEALGDPWGLGLTLFYQGLAADALGDVAAAARHYTAALRWLDTVGDAHHAGFVHCFLGVAEWKRGELPHAVEHIQAAVRTGVALRDRYLLSMGAQATAALVGAGAAPERRARLLGAADAFAQATASLAWERHPGGQDMAELLELRARLTREGEDGELAAAYRKGRTLPFSAVADLALHLLEEGTQQLTDREAAQAGAQSPERPSQPTSPLTAREQEVLRLVAQGRSTKAIGQQLFLSPSTVNHHLTAIFTKLGVNTRAQAVAVAAQRELL